MDKELEELFGMLEDLFGKIKGNPWIPEEEIAKIQAIIDDYKLKTDQTDTPNEIREEFYNLYKTKQDEIKEVEKYTPSWEKKRRQRDMYFKFLNIPILFIINAREQSFDFSNGSELT